MSRQLWMLVGGNGSGKSTFYHQRIEPLGLPFVNADIIARQLFPDQPERHSYEAAQLAEQQRLQLIQTGRSFCFETVFSHPSKIDFVAQAKAFGYEIILVWIHLENTELNNARVSQRVQQGGHNVPEEKVTQRVPRLLRNIQKVIPLCDRVYALENSLCDQPYRKVFTQINGELEIFMEPFPIWAMNALTPSLSPTE